MPFMHSNDNIYSRKIMFCLWEMNTTNELYNLFCNNKITLIYKIIVQVYIYFYMNKNSHMLMKLLETRCVSFWPM